MIHLADVRKALKGNRQALSVIRIAISESYSYDNFRAWELAEIVKDLQLGYTMPLCRMTRDEVLAQVKCDQCGLAIVQKSKVLKTAMEVDGRIFCSAACR